jgi:lipopolysaccharide/colanic/teichoic acid biosynthesis glycosyltransferase
VVSVDLESGELVIDLRSLDERAGVVSLDRYRDIVVDLPTVHVSPKAGRDRLKRCFDVGATLAASPVWVPVLLVLAGLVRGTSRGPAFYVQDRIGQGGRTIRCLKLRTMVADADERLADVLGEDPELAAEFARDHKLRDDPRVTRFGKLLRRTSIDELPQLVNVLRGEMSLVGPRPIVADEIPRYGRFMPIVLTTRPGVTGLWQVSGRNDVSYASRIALDVQYTFEQSFRGDLRILLRTVTRVLRPSRGGGY